MTSTTYNGHSFKARSVPNCKRKKIQPKTKEKPMKDQQTPLQWLESECYFYQSMAAEGLITLSESRQKITSLILSYFNGRVFRATNLPLKNQ